MIGEFRQTVCLDRSCGSPSPDLKADQGDVHIWRTFLVQHFQLVEDLYGVLSPEERLRARRFHSERHQNGFIIAHGSLRSILGLYLKVPPSQVEFVYNEYGKPSIGDKWGNAQLEFSLSHSNELALLAVACSRSIGIDIEPVRAVVEPEVIARRFFAPEEAAELLAVPEGLRSTAFLYCWTRKEAYIKARGMGLSIPLDSFQVSLAPGRPAAFIVPDTVRSGWSLLELAPAAGYIGALALEGLEYNIQCFEWTPACLVGARK